MDGDLLIVSFGPIDEAVQDLQLLLLVGDDAAATRAQEIIQATMGLIGDHTTDSTGYMEEFLITAGAWAMYKDWPYVQQRCFNRLCGTSVPLGAVTIYHCDARWLLNNYVPRDAYS